MELKNIEIDIDVYRTIETHRQSFSETHNDILHRLLMNLTDLYAVKDAFSQPTVSGWESKQVFFPDNTKLKMTYNGKTVHGIIDNGNFMVEHQKFNSFSAAANAFARNKLGQSVNLNGWNVFQAQLPGTNKWIPVSQLYKQTHG